MQSEKKLIEFYGIVNNDVTINPLNSMNMQCRCSKNHGVLRRDKVDSCTGLNFFLLYFLFKNNNL